MTVTGLTVVAQQIAETLGGGEQPDLLEARRMQALSLGIHIPIVCFGIAFPAMILFVHGLYLRTGRPVYGALAKRWAKVALIIFAVGVVTGKVVNPRPLEALFNDNVWHEFTHMYFAGIIVVGFIVAGVYASAWLK